MVCSTVLWKVRHKFEAHSSCSVIAEVLGLAYLIILATYPSWQDDVDDAGSEREIKHFPSRTKRYASLALSFAVFLLLFTSALWQHSSAVSYVMALQIAFEGAILGRVGEHAMALAWVGTGLAGCVTVGLFVYELWLSKIDRETRNPEATSPVMRAPARAGIHEDE